MKGCLYILLLFFWSSVTAQEIEFKIVSNAPNDQTLYTGKSNIIELINFPRNATIKTKFGFIQKLEKSTIALFEPFRNIPATDTLTVMTGLVPIVKRGFKVVFTPGAYFQLGTITSDTISAPQLVIPPRNPNVHGFVDYRMLTKFPDSVNIDSAAIISDRYVFRVTGFSISFQRPRQDFQGPYISNSNKLNEAQKGLLLRACPGTIIYIDDVTWDCSGCKVFVNPKSLHQRIFVK